MGKIWIHFMPLLMNQSPLKWRPPKNLAMIPRTIHLKKLNQLDIYKLLSLNAPWFFLQPRKDRRGHDMILRY